MKKHSFALGLILCTLWVQPMFAQVKIGLIGGVSSSDIPRDQLLIYNDQTLDTFTLSARQADYGLHFGFFIRGEIGKFYIEPALVFNSNKIDFRIAELEQNGAFGKIKSESYQYLDIPLILGYKYGILRLGAGPVGHLFIDSSSELFDVSGYRQKFDAMTWGWQANLGLDIWMLRFDLRYEGNFNNYGDHFEFFGRKYSFHQQPGRLIASAGITF